MEGKTISVDGSPRSLESTAKEFEAENKSEEVQTSMQNETKNQQSEIKKPGEACSIKESEYEQDEIDYKDVLSEKLINQVKGVIYGNCIGDAIGLLTEFMNKEQAHTVYGAVGKHFFTKDINLEYDMKSDDSHRIRWVQGDWTDDSDQMILIMQTLLERNGQFDKLLFSQKMLDWCKKGFPELGDAGGMGRGMTTVKVLQHPHYQTDPHKAAHDVWVKSGYYLAPNGGVMRTSILGTMEYQDTAKVIENTKSACRVTHADPRCVASCIAVTIAISLMLQGKHTMKNGDCNVDAITKEAHAAAELQLEKDDHKKELHAYMFEKKLQNLKLGESIGYTFKCLGAGFWAFKQKNFRNAIQELTMEAGDADTNCAVAGALLGCKLGFHKLPDSWVKGLKYREWLDMHINRYLKLLYVQEGKNAELKE